MREFFEKLMTDDENNMKFTKYEMVMYGIVLPLGLVLLIGIARFNVNGLRQKQERPRTASPADSRAD